MKKYIYLLMLTVSCLSYGISHAQYKNLHEFLSIPNDGQEPFGTLLLNGGKLYGMTNSGGLNDVGVIFSTDTNGGNYKILHNFNDTNGGDASYCSLTIAGGKLYGLTNYGGINNCGVIFSLDTNGNAYKVLYYFDSIHGKSPFGKLAISGKTLFGSTVFGGTNYNPSDEKYEGTVFSIDTNGNGFKVLLNFNGTDGEYPYASLILEGNTLYGTTEAGGKYGGGTIFSMDTNGAAFTILYNFGDSNSINAAGPNGIIVYSDSALYGVTFSGGVDSSGVVFAIRANGTRYKILHQFGTSCNEGYSYASLAISGKTLFGLNTAITGGQTSNIFSVDTNGNNYTCLHSFVDSAGYDPIACGLTLFGGEIYGVTSMGGSNSAGVIFRFKDTAITTGTTELKIKNEGLKVYPNPSFNGKFSFEITNYPIGMPPHELGITNTIHIYSVFGQQVYSAPLNLPQGGDFKIDLHSQPEGIYLYRVTSEKGELVGSGKLVIE